mmetsp:Transcript_7731/g.13081  ORF Transcript_7731/g.13081 Transcript_7731/m.13081 type:complete len:496 (-) Transcript_7731:197-1684(-)
MGNVTRRGSSNRNPSSSQEVVSAEWNEANVLKMITEKKLAPRDAAGEFCIECPICFLDFAVANTVKCCKQCICTDCVVQLNSKSSKTPCPFCGAESLEVTYSEQQHQGNADSRLSMASAEIKQAETESTNISKEAQDASDTQSLANLHYTTPEQEKKIRSLSCDLTSSTSSKSDREALEQQIRAQRVRHQDEEIRMARSPAVRDDSYSNNYFSTSIVNRLGGARRSGGSYLDSRLRRHTAGSGAWRSSSGMNVDGMSVSSSRLLGRRANSSSSSSTSSTGGDTAAAAGTGSAGSTGNGRSLFSRSENSTSSRGAQQSDASEDEDDGENINRNSRVIDALNDLLGSNVILRNGSNNGSAQDSDRLPRNNLQQLEDLMLMEAIRLSMEESQESQATANNEVELSSNSRDASATNRSPDNMSVATSAIQNDNSDLELEGFNDDEEEEDEEAQLQRALALSLADANAQQPPTAAAADGVDGGGGGGGGDGGGDDDDDTC